MISKSTQTTLITTNEMAPEKTLHYNWPALLSSRIMHVLITIKRFLENSPDFWSGSEWI